MQHGAIRLLRLSLLSLSEMFEKLKRVFSIVWPLILFGERVIFLSVVIEMFCLSA